MARCSGRTREGKRCRLPPLSGSTRCKAHGQVTQTWLNVVKRNTPVQKMKSTGKHKPRSNIGKKHRLLNPLPCYITQFLKTSKKKKIYTFRIAKSSGVRYKQYCKKYLK